MSFQLERVAPSPAIALLVLSRDARHALGALANAGRGARLFDVAGGWLVLAERAIDVATPRAVRLRRAADGSNLLVPADAELLPSLLDDEARGLPPAVLLPGGRALAWKPDAPVALSIFIATPPLARSAWSPLAEPEPLAPALASLARALPPEATEEVLDQGAPSPGESAPDEKPGAGARAKMNLGRAAFKLGKALGLGGLARAGARWMEQALSRAPGLGADLLGKQEAALRDLLRRFREGKIDEALRRALPLGEPGGARGASAATGAQLPTHDLRWSLGQVLAGGKGPASVWLGGEDVQRQLALEYRRAAEKAVADGDPRRAAFIYGKLLRDFRQAARVLERAGLHHDAAVLYLERVGDRLAAARAFAAAGELERAVAIYREEGQHVAAGDLLRSCGEEEAAVVEYRAAAEKLAAYEGGLRAAGDLLAVKANRPDLALAYFERGWALGVSLPNGIACGLRLAQTLGKLGDAPRLVALSGEIDRALADPGNDGAASQLWNGIARVARAEPALEKVKDDLLDRARLGIATKLRQRAARENDAQAIARDLLGDAVAFPPAVTSDGAWAVLDSMRRRRDRARASADRVRVARGTVTAACAAPTGGEIFIGLDTGEVFALDVTLREPQRLCLRHPPVIGIAVDPHGSAGDGFLVALRAGSPGEAELSVFVRRGGAYLAPTDSRRIEADAPLIAPRIVGGGFVGLWDGENVLVLDGPRLLPFEHVEPPEDLAVSALILGSDSLVLVGDGRAWWALHWEARPPLASIGWTPALRPSSSLAAPPCAFGQWSGNKIELAGLSEGGAVSWSSIERTGGGEIVVQTASRPPADREGWLAVAIVRPGLVAAVGARRVEWLAVEGSDLEPRSTTEVSTPGAVAAFAIEPSGELAIVERDGTVVLVRSP